MTDKGVFHGFTREVTLENHVVGDNSVIHMSNKNVGELDHMRITIAGPNGVSSIVVPIRQMLGQLELFEDLLNEFDKLYPPQ